MKKHLSTLKEKPYLRLGVAGAASLLASVPLARIIYIVFSVGTNNPSNDDISIVRFLGRYWAGNYQWGNFARDTFDGGHAIMLPTLVYTANSHLTGLDIRPLLIFGIFLAAAKLLLIHNAIVRSAPDAGWYSPWLLLLVLSALVFSVTQICVYEFNFTSVTNGLYKIGYAIVIWALVRFPRRWTGVWIALTGAMISTFSSGVLSWPILLIGMLLLGFRKPLQYVAVIIGGCIAALPYALYLKAPASQGNLSPFNPKLVLNILGRPFANGIGTHYGDMWVAVWIAIGGAVLVSIGLVIVWQLRRGAPLSRFAPALMLLAFGLLFCWQISMVRVSVAPWYAANAMDFWIGMVALAYLVWAFRKTAKPSSKGASEPRTPRRSLTTIAATAWPPLAILVVVFLFCFSNRTYSDKSFFMPTRAPVSVACLQNYRIAPTYCGGLVHLYVGVPTVLAGMAKPLEDHHMSVFGPHQTWTLQGDSILPTVSYSDVAGVPETRWSRDLSSAGVPITDYHQLNLLMSPSNSVSWTVSLPQSLKEGHLYSAIALSSSAPHLSDADRLQFLITAITEDGQERPLFSQYLRVTDAGEHPFSLDLSEYAGKTITLRLRSAIDGNAAGAWAVFRYPYIDARLDPLPVSEQSGTVAPSNTDQSPFCVNKTPDDFRFDINDQSLWEVGGLTRAQPDAGKVSKWVLTGKGGSSMTYKVALNLPMNEYSHLYVRMSASVDLQPRSFAVIYTLRDPNGALERRTAVVPLLQGGEMHTHTFDLRLNGPKSGYELDEFVLLPAHAYGGTGPAIHIDDVRLIRRKAVPANSPGKALNVPLDPKLGPPGT